MKFQVLKNGKVVFWTTDESCIPDDEEISCLKKAGYKIKKTRSKEDNDNSAGQPRARE